MSGGSGLGRRKVEVLDSKDVRDARNVDSKGSCGTGRIESFNEVMRITCLYDLLETDEA